MSTAYDREGHSSCQNHAARSILKPHAYGCSPRITDERRDSAGRYAPRTAWSSGSGCDSLRSRARSRRWRRMPGMACKSVRDAVNSGERTSCGSGASRFHEQTAGGTPETPAPDALSHRRSSTAVQVIQVSPMFLARCGRPGAPRAVQDTAVHARRPPRSGATGTLHSSASPQMHAAHAGVQAKGGLESRHLGPA
jgi:hypothetical protein